MPKSRSLVVVGLLLVPLLIIALTIPYQTVAQDAEVGTPPAVLTPGQPLSALGAQPTLDAKVCYPPLPLEIGQVIYIEPGVNIRSAADGSSPIVWNTSYNNRDQDGRTIDPTFDLQAYVLAGPVCTLGQNWWQVRLPGNDGWVAEGRPDDGSGYLLRIPGVDSDAICQSPYGLQAGDVADLLLNARVRTEPDVNALVRTIAPAGTPVEVIAGPRCLDRVNWWQVRVNVAGVTYSGWMAEGLDGIVWLLPADLPSYEDGTLCGAPLDLPLGSVAYVDSFDGYPHNLRAAPGTNAPIVEELIDGVSFEMIGGPACRNNLNWWQVRLLAPTPLEGWIAEGSTGVGYWISRLNPNEYGR